MASIIRAEIVGTRMAENGSYGYTVNSTSYSVLVFYSNGVVELVEGDAKQINPLLPYMSPREDFNQLKSLLEQFEMQLKTDISHIVEKALFENRNPLPEGLTGKSGSEVKKILENAGFKVEFFPINSEKTSGTVMECERKTGDLMTVILKMRYDMPNVEDLHVNEAIQKLKNAGFIPKIIKGPCEFAEEDKVFNIVREGDGINVILWVCNNEKREEYEFIEKIKQLDSMIDIWKCWENSSLVERYPNVNECIKKKKDIERIYGKVVVGINKSIQDIENMLCGDS